MQHLNHPLQKNSKLADNFSRFIGNTGIYELTEERW
jgi:hypothetical protein